jgi:hypothetical protein
MQTDCKDEQELRAFEVMRVSRDSDSNVNEESQADEKKHPSPTISTEAGRQTDFNNEPREKIFASI